MTSPAEIRPETPDDLAAIDEIHRQAFPGPDEALLVAALRNGGHITTALVALLDGQPVGHIVFSRLQIGSGEPRTPAIALAPIAVRREHQNQGIGSALIRAGLDTSRDAGETLAVVLGDPNYYGRFGFSAALAEPLESVYAGPAFQVAELTPGAMLSVRGPVVYADPFNQL